MSTPSSILFYGYGNLGRGDDGLGPRLVAALEDWDGVACESDYQLSVEDSATVAQYEVVVFVDAEVKGPAPFRFCRVAPARELSFSSHSATPGQVLALAQDMFGAKTQAFTLGIRGYAFGEMCEVLSDAARANLGSALTFAKRVLEERQFDEYAKQYGRGCGCDPQPEA